MDSEETGVAASEGCAPVHVTHRTKILAYLGELKNGEFVSSRKLVNDLGLRFTTAKNILTELEEEWLVEKKITTERGVMALFRISPTAKVKRSERVNAHGVATMESRQMIPFVPPEWSDAYGKHPSGI